MLRRIAAHYLLTPQGLQRDRIISFTENREVVDICPAKEIDSLCGVEFYNGILIPDMVNAHSHLELSYLRGAIEPSCGFAGFARGISQVRGQFGMEERERIAADYDAVMYNEGIGAVGDICNGSSTIAIKDKSSILYHSFIELFGLAATDTSPIDAVVDAFKGSRQNYCVTAHSTYSLNSSAFAKAVEATPSSPLSIHFMESRAEADLFEGRGELWRWYQERGMEVDFTAEGSPAKRIISHIDPSRGVLLVHNTFIRKTDIEQLIAHFGENLTFVLCPRSNIFIEGQSVDVNLLRESGCRVAIGTDSLASAETLSMIDQITLFEDVPLEERLFWITRNGAEALGMADRIGSFVVGRRSGAVLVEGVDFETMNLGPKARARRIL